MRVSIQQQICEIRSKYLKKRNWIWKREQQNYCPRIAFFTAARHTRLPFCPKGTFFAWGGTSQSLSWISICSECLHVQCFKKIEHKQNKFEKSLWLIWISQIPNWYLLNSSKVCHDFFFEIVVAKIVYHNGCPKLLIVV